MALRDGYHIQNSGAIEQRFEEAPINNFLTGKLSILVQHDNKKHATMQISQEGAIYFCCPWHVWEVSVPSHDKENG